MVMDETEGMEVESQTSFQLLTEQNFLLFVPYCFAFVTTCEYMKSSLNLFKVYPGFEEVILGPASAAQGASLVDASAAVLVCRCHLDRILV